MAINRNGGIPDPDGQVTPINTDYTIGQDNMSFRLAGMGFDVHNRVFVASSIIVLMFVVFTILFQETAELFFLTAKALLTSTLDSFFILAGNLFVLICLGLMLSPLGKVRIGGTDALPDYSYPEWLAMLFAAGMGIGLVFFGVSEPMSHFQTALQGIDIQGEERGDWAPLGGAQDDAYSAHKLAMAATLYHWTLHPWSIYALLSLGLAIFSFNKGLPLTIRSLFYPILRERVWGKAGDWIDTLAVIATIFGLATSLGYGASQVSSGLEFLIDMPANDWINVTLIIAITLLALLSVLAGLDGGVKRLSEVNMFIAALLLGFVLLAGPTKVLFSNYFNNLTAYFEHLFPISQPFSREDENFSQGWTAFYWAWWISWSPFVGMFIARVSRGRTVREFLFCVVVIPSAVCVMWMTVFGGTAIYQYVTDGYQAVFEAELPVKLFAMLSAMPFSDLTSFLGLCLVVLFFITSADSGSLVIDTIAVGGKVDAPVPQRIYWCCFEGLVAIALMLGGGLAAAQAMAVIAGFPFAVVLLVAAVSLIKGLMDEPRGKRSG